MDAYDQQRGFLRRFREKGSARSTLNRRRARTPRHTSPLVEILDDRLLLSANPIVTENQLPGTPESVWLVPQGQSSTSLQGFTTDISVNVGQTVFFKITDTTLDPYEVDVYRIGWYGGDGASLKAIIPSSQTLAQNQPAPIVNPSTGEVDAGNWAVSASWTVPTNAVSGVYLADLVDDKTGVSSMIVFVVRNDASHSEMLFQVDDAAWQAYNDWGGPNNAPGASLYTGNGPTNNPSTSGAAYAVSYNRPLNNYNNTSEGNYRTEFFYAEFPMVEWLEENGYDVSYFTDVDADRFGSLIQNHQIWMDAGHDEYWSGNEFANVMAARNAGVDLAFFSGNEIFWKTYYSTSIDGSNTADRTLVCYKETHANAIIDPNNPDIWTGTWADPRFSPPADGGIGQNELTGTFFTANIGADAVGTPITVPGTDANLPIWRNTAIAKLAPNQSTTIGGQVLGYEWDSDVANAFRPAGEIDLSSTTQNVSEQFVDWGNVTQPGTLTHSLTEYRAASGALVFGAGTVQWSWGLSNDHYGNDSRPDPDPNMQQATVNLFADMGAQPGTLQAGLVPATQTALSSAPPTSAITWPPPGASLPSGTPVTITGTASAAPGAFVVGVEVSTDGGRTWYPAQGTTSWSYTWTPGATGPVTIESRAVDDTVNLGPPSAGVTATVTQPTTSLTLFGVGVTPGTTAANDSKAIALGVRFTSDVSGFITGIRFYKGPGNTGTHIGHLWTSTGTLLGTVTFTSETASGWQEADFSTPVAVTAGTTYVASYYAPAGHYADDQYYFAMNGVNSGPLHIPPDVPGKPASVFSYGADAFPTTTFLSANYYVDVVFSATAITGPRVSSISPLPGAQGIATNTAITAQFNESIQLGTLSFVLTDSNGNTVPATLSYDGSTNTATLTPNALLSYPGAYTATVSGAVDQNGLAMTSTVSWSFNTSFQVGTTYSFWNNATQPLITSANDPNPVELGVMFESSVSGSISGIRFYDGNPASLDSHGATGDTFVAHLWTTSGTLLATANLTLIDDSSLGWQQVSFAKPVAITANTLYVASYYAPEGGYAENIGYFANAGFTNGPLSALSTAQVSALSGTDASGNGLYTYGTGGGFPTSSFAGTNYWVDPVFSVTAVPPPPSVTAKTPASGATGIDTITPITVTFSEPVQPNSVSISVIDASGKSVTGSLSYNSTSNTMTFIPGAPLAISTQYTVTVSGAADSLGHVMTTPLTWSFSTASAATYTLFSSSATPSNPSASDASAIEVGVRFESAIPGFITGIRFYKGTTNTGTHVGDLWSSAGVLLASATFTQETAAGWQFVSFATPVGIAADTIYVASYYAPNGGYADDGGYFASSGVSNGPLTAPSNSAVGGNGVFVYGTGGGFPSNSFNAANYWVDVAFSPGKVNAPPPTVTAESPGPGATGVTTNIPITATFSEPIQPGTISFTLTDPSGISVAGSLSYNAATNSIAFDPTLPLNISTHYTANVNGATDYYGNSLTAPVSWSFTTSATATYTVWADTAAPANPSVNDPAAVELGVKFESAVPGYLAGIRFYKGPKNTGTHIGYLWTSTGTLLASATFTVESATGWQEVDFANPVPIAAGQVYIASYYAPNGGYADDGGYFASSGVTRGPLTALSNTQAGGQGVFVYGTPGAFPTSSFNASNYWVDVLFNPGTVNTAPPTVTAQTPLAGATGVSASTAISATFSDAIQSSTISFTVTDASSNNVAGSLSYDPTSNTATFTPNNTLATSTQYTATVSGATDFFGNALTAPVSWSFTTSATATYSLWSNSAKPANPSANDPNAVELGVKFEAAVPGFITGVRFYKGSGNTGTHVGYLWDSSGHLLATATFTSETASGWQQVAFANPVPIAANTVYIASYYAPNGDYADDVGYFGSTGVTNGPLQALSDTAAGGQGVFVYGTGGGFPANSFSASNYWVDVQFTPGDVNNPPPMVTAQSPAPSATGVSTLSPISVTFSNAIQPGTISLTLTDSSGHTVSGSLIYNAATETATFTPAAPFATATVYTATVSGALDYYDHTLTAPVTWSFTTSPLASYTLWNSAAAPVISSANNPAPAELGVKFESSASGYVTGVRFYKGTGNTGTHVGHLWDASGNLLATATFTNETATGWQQLLFSSPVPISANTVYIASYFAPNGGFADDAGYFASSGLTSGPLHALSNAEANGNDVFADGSSFPSNTFGASNYWVDVIFQTTPPTVVATTPSSAAIGVAPGLPVSATFNKPVQLNTVSFVLKDSAGNVVGSTFSIDVASQVATLIPSAPLAYGTTYTATLSGAQDSAGDGMSGPYSWSFTTIAADTGAPTVTSETPAAASTGAPAATTVSATFNEDVQASTVSFVLQGPAGQAVPATFAYDPLHRTVTLRPTATLAPATTYTAVLSGAQDLAGTTMTPVSWTFTTATASASATLVAETPAPNATGVPVAGELTAAFSAPVQASTIGFTLKNGSTPVAGTLSYDAATNVVTFNPSANLASGTTYTATISGVEDLFGTTLSPVSWSFTTETAAPAVTVAAQSPAANATGVAPTSPVTATFSAQVQASKISFTLSHGSTPVPATVVYNPATMTLSLEPSSSLAYATTYTATLSGVSDLYGNTLAALSWSFTTAPAPGAVLPTLTAESPASGATGVPLAGNISATFSEAVVPGTISFVLQNGTATVPAQVSYDPATGIATLDPASLLAPSTTYTVVVSGAQDLYGNTMAPTSWTFTTESAVTTAPTVIAQSPASGAGGVPIAGDLTATFSASVQPSTISFVLTNGSTPVAARVSYDPTTNTVTLIPASNLSYATPYTATLSGARDLYGNTMSQVSWTFTTKAPFSTTPPTVTAESPASGATAVPLAGNVTATFSTQVQASTISFVLMNGTSAVPAHVSYNSISNVVTIDPTASLLPATTYTAVLSGAQDLAGDTMSTLSWSFTTESTVTTAPTVTAESPSAGATGVAIASPVTATFSAQVQPSTIAFALKSGSATVAASASYNPVNQTVTLTPSASLAYNTTYTVSMSGAQDLYGNTMSALSWSFTTASAPLATAPKVTAQTPASGAGGVAIASFVTATFSEQVQASTITFTLKNGSTTVAATMSYDPASETVILKPTSSLAYNTTYTATLTGAKDLYGNTMPSTSWTFTTTAAPVTTAPTVTVQSPTSGATAVPVNSFIAATFNRAVQATTISFSLATGSTSVAEAVFYNASNQTVTLTPSANLAYSTTYTATLSGAQDTYGNTMSTVSWSFTTTSSPLTALPTVTATSPAAGAANVAIASFVTATFSEAVQPNTISFTLKNGSTSIAATASYSPATQTAIFTPSASLAYATTYTVSVSGATDLYGNTMTPVSWSFTTTSAPVTTAPTVTARTPASGATGVAIGTDVSATFSTAVQASTISFVLKTGSTTIGSSVAYDPATHMVALNPTSSLSSSTTYTATLSGAKDLYGNTMASTSWSFTTAAAPGSAPAVTAETPAPGAILVATGSSVKATFNEAVTASTVNVTNFVLKTSGGSTVAATVSYNSSGHVATLKPSSALAPSTTYTATISGVTDSHGRTMASPFSWSFTTAGTSVTTAPTITARSPASGATGVLVASPVTATFSAQVQASTISFVLKNGSTTVPATVSYNPANQTVILKPSSNLAYSTTYTATLSGAKDLYGNTMSSTSWSFTTTTAPVTTAPTVTVQGPASGATGVLVASPVTATFSAQVQPGTISFTLKNGSTTVSATVSYNPVNAGVILNPASSLAYSTTYTATLSGAKDLYGNTITTVSWSFTTTSAPVTTAPTVAAQSPASGATGVPIASPVTAAVTAPIQATTINFTLTNGSSFVPATVSYNAVTQVITLAPSSSLAYATTYTATLSGVQDLYGNTMSTVSWSFTTTLAPVTTAPTVSVSPASGVTNVAIVSPVTAAFSAEVQPATISLTLMNGTTAVAGSVNYDPGSQAVTFTPSSPPSYGTTYTATLSGAQDLYGNTVVSTSWSFTTTTAPTTTVVSQSPAANASGVAITSNLTATFSAEVQAGTISFVLMNGSSAVPATVSYDPTTDTVTLDPTASLSSATTYTAILSGATDLYGNTISTLSWSFTTAAGPSTAPPTLIAQSPAPGAGAVPLAGNVTATFSEEVQASTISFTLMNGSTALPATATYDATTDTLTLHPAAPLTPATTYTVVLSGVQDAAGNVMSPASWSFTTEGAVTTPPTLVAQSPAAGASSVSVAANVTATFGVEVQAGTIGFALMNGTTAVSATFSYDPITDTVTLDPTAALSYETTYVATLSGAKDLYGNTMASVSWSFTTETAPTTPPTLTAESPAPGATGVATSSPITATFSTAVQPATITATLLVGTTPVAATASFNPATDTLALIPNGGLAYGTTYTVTVSGAQDLYGNTMSSTSWSFTTAQAPVAVPPTVTAQTPASGATAVPVAGLLTATFSEQVQPSTISFALSSGATPVAARVSYDPASQTVTLDPLANLAPSTTYTAVLSGAEDLSGDVMTTLSWSFTTESAVTAAPTLTAQTPAPGATGVAIAPAVSASFSEQVLPTTISFVLTNGTTQVPATWTYNPATQTVTLIPTANLAPLATYAVTLSGVVDLYGNAMATVSWSFTNEGTDTTAPTVTAQSPAPAATNVAVTSGLSVTFSKEVQASTLVFSLTSGSTPVAATLSYNPATETATLVPSASLGYLTTYTVKVSGGEDLSGNVMAPVSWSFTTQSGAWTQSSVAAFSSGTQSNTAVGATATGGGQVTLGTTVFSDNFAGTALSSTWTTTSSVPAGGGPTSVTVNNGLSIGGAEVISTPMIPPGGAVQGSVEFGAAQFQNFGMATDFATTSGNSWAVFATEGTTDTLFAQVNQSGNVQSVNLGALPSGFHTYLIQPVTGGIQFSIDGSLVATINLSIPSGTTLSIAMSAFGGSPQPALQVASVSTTTYASSGTFTSSVLDVGSNVAWGTANWTASLPPGTSITILTSSSTDGVNWSAWSSVTNGGTINSPAGRFFRYEVILTTTNPAVTPALTGITFTWT
jgi:methionine-rich copper-binding protein CopC